MLCRLAHVTREYRTAAATVVAVDEVSFAIDAGVVVGLIGPSGSGKTTTLNLVLGWEEPTHGTVISNLAGDGWHRMSVVPQDLGLLPELTAAENVWLPWRFTAGTGPAASVDESLESLGLEGLSSRYPDELSMGEQQRVAVARATIVHPRLLVADEPTSHQDERRAGLVMDRLVAVARLGGAVVVATHDERLLGRVDRVIRMLDGRVV